MTRRRISVVVKERVRQAAGHRCGYCLTQQRYAMQVLEIEHIIPTAASGTDTEENLWLACRLCNNAKRAQTHGYDPATGRYARLFNPRRQQWQRHFHWSVDGTQIIGRTVCGRATVAVLNLNNEIALVVRRNRVTAGWHPPQS